MIPQKWVVKIRHCFTQSFSGESPTVANKIHPKKTPPASIPRSCRLWAKLAEIMSYPWSGSGWCWYMAANMTGVDWWDPCDTMFFRSTVNGSPMWYRINLPLGNGFFTWFFYQPFGPFVMIFEMVDYSVCHITQICEEQQNCNWCYLEILQNLCPSNNNI